MMILYPEHRKKAFDENLLSREDFFTDLGKRIFDFLLERYKIDDNITDFNESFRDDEVGRIVKMKRARMELESNGTEVFLDAIAGLKKAMSKNMMKKNDSIEALSEFLNKKRNQNS